MVQKRTRRIGGRRYLATRRKVGGKKSKKDRGKKHKSHTSVKHRRSSHKKKERKKERKEPSSKLSKGKFPFFRRRSVDMDRIESRLPSKLIHDTYDNYRSYYDMKDNESTMEYAEWQDIHMENPGGAGSPPEQLPEMLTKEQWTKLNDYINQSIKFKKIRGDDTSVPKDIKLNIMKHITKLSYPRIKQFLRQGI